MKLTYDQPHVSMRMRQRNIEHCHVELTLADPQVEYPTEPKSNATHVRP